MKRAEGKASNWEEFFQKKAQEFFSQEGVILDVGGGTPYQKELKPFFNQRQASYFSIDFAASSRPHVVGDALCLPVRDGSIDVVILKSVLEHVKNPFTAIAEIKRVLRNKGQLILWVPFLYPYHAAGTYEDYFRFTDDGVKEILRGFSEVAIIPTRGYFETLANLLPKPFSKLFGILGKALDRYYGVKKQHSGFGAFAIK